MAHIPGHRARPRKSDRETFDMLDCSILPKSLIDEGKPPRFANIIEAHGNVEDHDGRANFVRYMEDCILPITYVSNLKRLRTLAEQSARAYRFYEHLGVLERKLAHQLTETGGDESVIPPYLEELHATEACIAESVIMALKAINGLRHNVDEDLAMLIEIPYMALRGSKSLLIVASHRGPFYRKWEKQYPYLWQFHKGPPDFDEEELLAPDLEDDGILSPTAYTQQRYNHSPRPIWWGDMELGGFSKICRRLVPLTDEEKEQRLYTPAILLHWRTRPKKNTPLLVPYEDYRT